jgi:hypothetical protein
MNKKILLLYCTLIFFAAIPIVLSMIQPKIQISDVYGNDTSYNTNYIQCVSAMAEVKNACHQIVKTEKETCMQKSMNSDDKRNSAKWCSSNYKSQKKSCRIGFLEEKKNCAKIKHTLMDSIKVMFK